MVTKLDGHESALLCVQMARDNLRGKTDMRSQLADVRLKAACEALSGAIDIQAYEIKIMGLNSRPCTSNDTSKSACGVECGDRLGDLWYCRRERGEK